MIINKKNIIIYVILLHIECGAFCQFLKFKY